MAGDEPIRIIPHSPPGIPDTEVRFADGRESWYFYWDENGGRRSITGACGRAEAMEQAKSLARAEREKLRLT